MLRKHRENTTSGKRVLRSRYSLAYWPDDVMGWLRIPSMLVFLAGLLGVLKCTWPLAARYLKSLNLPPIEFSWVMLIVGGTAYLLSVMCWLFFENIAKNSRVRNNTIIASSQWRSM